MKKFLLVALFALSLTSFGQMNDKQPLNPDSLMQKTNEQKDSISNKISTIKPTDNNDDIDRNKRYIQENQKKNNSKKKKTYVLTKRSKTWSKKTIKMKTCQMKKIGILLEPIRPTLLNKKKL